MSKNGSAGCQPAWRIGCIALVVMVLLSFAVLGVFAMSVQKMSPMYDVAVRRASADPRVIDALGSPIDEGWIVLGSVKVTGPGGEQSSAIPLSGPRGEAWLYAAATRPGGSSLHALVLELEGGRQIDLLAPAN